MDLWEYFVDSTELKTSPSKLKNATRGYTFWFSKEFEGGIQVKHMHADSLLIHPNFSSELMITWLNFSQTHFWSAFKMIENSLLIHLYWFELDQKWIGMHMLHVTSSFTYFTGPKVEPPRIRSKTVALNSKLTLLKENVSNMTDFSSERPQSDWEHFIKILTISRKWS